MRPDYASEGLFSKRVSQQYILDFRVGLSLYLIRAKTSSDFGRKCSCTKKNATATIEKKRAIDAKVSGSVVPIFSHMVRWCSAELELSAE
jgi:hypothetical protein